MEECIDYNDKDIVWVAIPLAWWLENKKCKCMLACFVHKKTRTFLQGQESFHLVRVKRMQGRKKGG
jgi:hypothetical protein